MRSLINIILNGLVLAQTDQLCKIGETLKLDGKSYIVVAVDYYEDPMILVREKN